jgi:hypothetical protein
MRQKSGKVADAQGHLVSRIILGVKARLIVEKLLGHGDDRPCRIFFLVGRAPSPRK